MPKMTDEQFSEEEPYRSIMNLIYCRSQWDKQENWDEIKKQKKVIGITFDQIFDGLQGSEKKGDPFFYKCGLVERGCVSSKERLTEQLRRLVREGFLTREGKPKYYQYIVSGKHLYFSGCKELYSRYLTYHPGRVLKLKNTKKNSVSILFGFPPDSNIQSPRFGQTASFNLSSDEDEQIFQWCKAVDENLVKIHEKKPNFLDFHWHID